MRFRSTTSNVVCSVLGLFLLAGSVGCAWSKNAYANNPLLRNREASIGNPVQCEPFEKWERPQPPMPPSR